MGEGGREEGREDINTEGEKECDEGRKTKRGRERKNVMKGEKQREGGRERM